MISTLIQWVDTKKTERVLWINYKDGIVFTIDIYAKTYKPGCKSVLDIIDDLNSKKAVLLTDDLWLTIAKDEDLKTHEKEKRDKAWEVLSYIFDKCNEPYIFESAKKSKYIKEASQIFSISERSIYEYLRRYWQGGKQINALLPNYKNCGGAGKDKSAGTKKRGRPSKYIGQVGANVDDRTKNIFRLAIKKFYFTSNQNSLKTVYELMIKEYFTAIRFEDGIKKPSIIEGNKHPSLSQFRYWYKKERDIQKEVTLRKSAKRYLLENRAVLGSSTQEALGPGSIYQIDATVADVYLVSRYNRNHIIGRGVVYTVVDVFSHMVVGMYVGLEGPSWIGAMMALSNACMDKVSFCKEYGITITDEEYPAHHLPDAIVADRGELEGKSVEGIISGLNIKILNTASYRADMKGIIEAHFKTISGKIKPFLPGFISKDYRQRGGRDYKLDARLDLYQFTQIILKTILHHNRSWLNNYKREEMAISDDIDPIPIKLWNWGIENRAGKLRTMPEDIVKLNLMPRDNTATVTGNGIKYKGIFYGCEKALREKWFEKARNFGSWKVNIAYDPRDMNFIYIIGSDFKSFEKCFLLKREERYLNKSLFEIEYLLKSEAFQQKENQEQELQSKVDLYADIEAIVKEAETANGKEQPYKSSNASKVKSIRGNRYNEKMMNREQEAFELGKSDCNKEVRVICLCSDETSFDLPTDTALLKKKQRERFNEHN